MNGKGSRQRPAAISQAELAENWELVFGKRKRTRTHKWPPPMKGAEPVFFEWQEPLGSGEPQGMRCG